MELPFLFILVSDIISGFCGGSGKQPDLRLGIRPSSVLPTDAMGAELN